MSPSGSKSAVFEGVRMGVVGWSRNALAAEEKKSPVVGRGSSAVANLIGVLNNCGGVLAAGIGVEGQLIDC